MPEVNDPSIDTGPGDDPEEITLEGIPAAAMLLEEAHHLVQHRFLVAGRGQQVEVVGNRAIGEPHGNRLEHRGTEHPSA